MLKLLVRNWVRISILSIVCSMTTTMHTATYVRILDSMRTLIGAMSNTRNRIHVMYGKEIF